jgi:hypothetical protein
LFTGSSADHPSFDRVGSARITQDIPAIGGGDTGKFDYGSSNIFVSSRKLASAEKKAEYKSYASPRYWACGSWLRRERNPMPRPTAEFS